MIGKITNKMFGLSHLGRFLTSEELQKSYANGYILDDTERIYYLIKTETDEFCFTNCAFIHIESNENKQNVLNRYDYSAYIMNGITLEVAGDMDLDSKLKFHLLPLSELTTKDEKYPPLKKSMPNYREGFVFSINIHRDGIENLRALYKTLVKIGKIQMQNIQDLKATEKSLEKAFDSIFINGKAAISTDEIQSITSFINQWILEKRKQYSNEDFSEVFETYFVG